MNIPDKLKYTNDHEWVKIDGEIAIVGITDFAQSELGDIVYVEINTIGDIVEKDSVFGTVEAVKTVSDLFMPITGEILEVNSALEESPEIINNEPYESGWIIKIKIEDIDQINQLLDSDAYKNIIGG
jgi:glycine cleavage system H protein